MSVNDVVQLFKIQLKNYITHHFHLNWCQRHQIQEIERPLQDLMSEVPSDYPERLTLIFTDFAAQWDLVPNQKVNSHVNQHVSVGVHVVLRNYRIVEEKDKSDDLIKKAVFDTHVAFFIGGANGKGKQNDHVFHNAALDAILKTEITRNRTVKLFTDGSPTQYACRQTIGLLNHHREKLALDSIGHHLAVKFGFKGAWDGYGKWIKDIYQKEMKSSQLNMHENARQVFEFLSPIIQKNQPSPDLMNKSTWTMTSNSLYFVTDHYTEYCELRENHGDKVLFTNREVVLPQRDKITPIPNLKTYRYFYAGPQLDNILPFDAGVLLEIGADGYFTCRCCHLKKYKKKTAMAKHERDCLQKHYSSEDYHILVLKEFDCCCENCYFNRQHSKNRIPPDKCKYVHVMGGAPKKHITCKKETMALIATH